MTLLTGALSIRSEVVQWELTGSLNYVHTALSEQFAVGDTFTMKMDMENSTEALGTDRPFFYSVGNFENAVIGGDLKFENGYSMELLPHVQGSFNIVNAGSTSASGYDQINIGFQTFDNSLVGEPVAGFDPANITLNFTDDAPPFDMLSGSEAAFPAYDLPFPGPTTFDLEKSTNSRFHFRLQFTGGNPEGTQFVRGSIDNISFGDGETGNPPPSGSNFEEILSNADLPDEAKAFEADANGDGIPNGIAYALGIPITGITEALRYRLPTIVGDQWRVILPRILPQDLTYEVMVSTSFNANWTTVASRQPNGEWEGSVSIDASVEEQTMTSDIAVHLDGNQSVFFTLRVTLNAQN